MGQQLQNLFKFEKFYNQIIYIADQLLVITKAIIEITDSLRESDFVQTYGGNKFEDDAMVFYERDKGLHSHLNRSFHMTAFIRGVGLIPRVE